MPVGDFRPATFNSGAVEACCTISAIFTPHRVSARRPRLVVNAKCVKVTRHRRRFRFADISAEPATRQYRKRGRPNENIDRPANDLLMLDASWAISSKCRRGDHARWH